jgi:hypothetical protein
MMLARCAPMLKELDEAEGPASSAFVRVCRPTMRRVIILQECIALSVKGGSAMGTLRR